MKFNIRKKLCLSLLVACSTLGPHQAMAALELLSDPNAPNTVVLSYDPSDGNLSYDGNGLLISTFELISASGLFIPDNVNPLHNLPPWGCCSAEKLFFLKTDGVTGMDLWNVLSPGLDGPTLSEELTLYGSILPNGAFPNKGLFIVPEPASTTLMGIGLLMVVRRRQSRVSVL